VLLGKIDRSPDLTGQIVTCEGRVKLLAVHGVGAPSGAFLKDSFDHKAFLSCSGSMTCSS
jgi:hypothetical protein